MYVCHIKIEIVMIWFVYISNVRNEKPLIMKRVYEMLDSNAMNNFKMQNYMFVKGINGGVRCINIRVGEIFCNAQN